MVTIILERYVNDMTISVIMALENFHMSLACDIKYLECDVKIEIGKIILITINIINASYHYEIVDIDDRLSAKFQKAIFKI